MIILIVYFCTIGHVPHIFSQLFSHNFTFFHNPTVFIVFYIFILIILLIYLVQLDYFLIMFSHNLLISFQYFASLF